jgi:hypothetical protein
MTQTSFQNNDTMINEQDAALAQTQARLQDALGRLARRENEGKLRLSELVGELEHLKLWQVGGARVCCGSGRRQMPQEQHLCVLAYLIGIVGVEWRDGRWIVREEGRKVVDWCGSLRICQQMRGRTCACL